MTLIKRDAAKDLQDVQAQRKQRLEELRLGRFVTETVTFHSYNRGWQKMIVIGDRFKISIVAGPSMYSTPRDMLKSIEHYTRVEVAIISLCEGTGYLSGQNFNAPTAQWAELTAHDDVAAYIDWGVVNKVCMDLITIAIDGSCPSY